MTMAEGAQPSIKNMALVRNRNNVSELNLAKKLREYDREQSLVLLSIDQDRLDMKDFLRQIRICESDQLPEARHWLGRKDIDEMQTIRDVVKAPPSTSIKKPEEEEVKRQQRAGGDTSREEAEVKDAVITGRFRTKEKAVVAPKLTLYNIYSRRAELVDAGPVWGENPGADDKEQQAVSLPEAGTERARSSNAADEAEEGKERTTNDSAEEKPAVSEREETTNCGKVMEQKEVTGSDIIDKRSSEHHHHHHHHHHHQQHHHRAKESRGTRHRQPPDGDDFMKELLVNNARRRYRKTKPKPIQDRLVDFYTRLDELKQEEAADEPTARQIRRRYVLLTRGVKAALELSSDEED